jgi:hypothetical protein
MIGEPWPLPELSGLRAAAHHQTRHLGVSAKGKG